jgi:hypothetical protein
VAGGAVDSSFLSELNAAAEISKRYNPYFRWFAKVVAGAKDEERRNAHYENVFRAGSDRTR